MAAIGLITNPKGAAKATQAIQEQLAAASFIDNAYGLCCTRIKTDSEGNQKRVPYVYVNGEYIEMCPDFDTYTGQTGNSVFFVNDRTFRYSEDNYEPFLLGAIFSLNIDTIVGAQTYDATSEVVDTVLKYLEDMVPVGAYIESEGFDVSADHSIVYKEWSYSEIDQRPNMHPYTVFRIDFYVKNAMECE